MQYEKMSKSKHNGVEPLLVLDRDGIDLTRLQLLSSAAPRAPVNWGDAGPFFARLHVTFARPCK